MAEKESIPTVRAERTAANTYIVRSAGGAELQISSTGTEGAFSPVELLQAAVAGCAALSAEAQLANRLGADFRATATAAAVLNSEENRIAELITTITADMSQLDPERQQRLVSSAERFVEQLCTVKRTLSHGTENTAEVRHRDS